MALAKRWASDTLMHTEDSDGDCQSARKNRLIIPVVPESSRVQAFYIAGTGTGVPGMCPSKN